MNLDDFDDLFETSDSPAAAPTQYEVIPEGRADVEILAASIGDVAWKATDSNPSGACLQLRLIAGRQYSFVFADIPRDRKPVFKALAAALGIAPDPSGKIKMPQPPELVGRRVAVEIGHYRTKTGDTKATVKRWLPAAPAAQAKAKPAASRPRASQPVVNLAPDDIPFVWLLPLLMTVVAGS